MFVECFKENKILDNFKVENYNCMGFRNFIFKVFKIVFFKLEGFFNYIELFEGW